MGKLKRAVERAVQRSKVMIEDMRHDRRLGHVDKWRSQRRIDVMSMKPRKLSAVLS